MPASSGARRGGSTGAFRPRRSNAAVRALNPAPGVWFEWQGERIKLLAATLAPAPAGAIPGTVLDAAPHIACGEGALRLGVLQRAGRAPLAAAEFLRGFALPPGTVLPCPATS